MITSYDRHVRVGTETLLFAVPNGGGRDALTGAILQGEGVRPGVSDLILLCRGKIIFIEVKLPVRIGRDGVRRPATYQSTAQKAFQAAVEALGHRYVVVRSIDAFLAELVLGGAEFRARPPELLRIMASS